MTSGVASATRASYAYEAMAGDSVGYEIREGATPDGGVKLEIVVEGATFARASASASILNDMQAILGLDKQAVVAHLRQALLDALKSQGQFVEVVDVTEDPARPLRFHARFTHRLGDELSTGLVWYDVNGSVTGPDALPAVVRNKMRFEVHRRLTGDGSAARALVDLHK